MQIDRCDQLTHYLSKFHTPSSTSIATSNGPSTEATAIDGYVVSGQTGRSCQLCIVCGASWNLDSECTVLQPRPIMRKNCNLVGQLNGLRRTTWLCLDMLCLRSPVP